MKTSEQIKEYKEYCKFFNLKFEKIRKKGFVCSQLIENKAGIRYNFANDKITDYKIRTVSKTRIYLHMNKLQCGSIVFGTMFKVYDRQIM